MNHTQPNPEPDAEIGLRARKKLRTRQRIVEAAVVLFTERGYAETTLAAIADRADIAQTTFFNYFSSKTDIVFLFTDQAIESVCDRVTGRTSDELTTAALVAWIVEEMPKLAQPQGSAFSDLTKLITSVPELRAAQRLRFAILDDTLATAFARDLGHPADSIQSRVMSTIASQEVLKLLSAWLDQPNEEAHQSGHDRAAHSPATLARTLEASLVAIKSLPSA